MTKPKPTIQKAIEFETYRVGRMYTASPTFAEDYFYSGAKFSIPLVLAWIEDHCCTDWRDKGITEDVADFIMKAAREEGLIDE